MHIRDKSKFHFIESLLIKIVLKILRGYVSTTRTLDKNGGYVPDNVQRLKKRYDVLAILSCHVETVVLMTRAQ